MSQVQQIVNKIVSDEKFRSALIECPADAFQQMGIAPTSEMLSAFEPLAKFGVEKLNGRHNAPVC